MQKIKAQSKKGMSICTILMFCFFITSYAQDNANEPSAADEMKKSKPFSFAIGVNFSDPIISLLKKQDPDSISLLVPNIYANLGYKRVHLRVGLGGQLLEKNNKSDLVDNVSSEVYYKYALTASLMHRTDISPRFSTYVGVSFWTQYYLNEKSYDSGYDLTTSYNEYIAYAGGPGIMLEYHLGSKISIFSEYCMLYRLDIQNVGRTFSAFPNESYKNHSSTLHSLNFQHPISLFINYKF